MITILLKDNSKKVFEKELSIIDIAKSISPILAKIACAGKVNNKVVDLRYIVKEDSKIEILTFEDIDGKKAFRHTASHILAQATKRLFKNVKLGMGPATENGFYYDFDKDTPFTQKDIENIEKEMKKIVKESLNIEKIICTKEEAINIMKNLKEDYKIEIIKDIKEGEIITLYKQGEFIDLCAGPHLLNTKYIKAIKLNTDKGSSGAYWKGNENNKMLNRIYGTAFTKNSDLEIYLKETEELKKRDHNKVGRDLKLFTTSDIIGQGLPLLMPKGARILQKLQRFVEDEEEKRGYQLTKTPLIAKSDLYKISGHWDHYKDGMFIINEENKKEIFALRPMTCPFQFAVYNSFQHSYRDLPVRYSETSTLFRNESSGEMHGLIRIRQFTISEGHIICTKEQIKEEFKEVLNLINYMMKVINIKDDITYRFSKWDPNNKSKYIGEEEIWEKTQNLMRNLLKELNLEFIEKEGEAAFYGPKLDIQFKNIHGKEDTIITVQIDFSLAERFNMTYIDKEGNKKYPIIIHRTSIGCYERLLAMLVEKYKGAFPLWLAPVQVKVLPISDKYNNYANEVITKLKKYNIKTEKDFRTEKIGYKIRDARIEKIPYIIILGEKEEKENTISIRSREKGEEGVLNIDTFIERILKEIESKDISSVLNDMHKKIK